MTGRTDAALCLFSVSGDSGESVCACVVDVMLGVKTFNNHHSSANLGFGVAATGLVALFVGWIASYSPRTGISVNKPYQTFAFRLRGKGRVIDK